MACSGDSSSHSFVTADITACGISAESSSPPGSAEAERLRLNPPPPPTIVVGRVLSQIIRGLAQNVAEDPANCFFDFNGLVFVHDVSKSQLEQDDCSMLSWLVTPVDVIRRRERKCKWKWELSLIFLVTARQMGRGRVVCLSQFLSLQMEYPSKCFPFNGVPRIIMRLITAIRPRESNAINHGKAQASGEPTEECGGASLGTEVSAT